jgi:hypothetical protein
VEKFHSFFVSFVCINSSILLFCISILYFAPFLQLYTYSSSVAVVCCHCVVQCAVWCVLGSDRIEAFASLDL